MHKQKVTKLGSRNLISTKVTKMGSIVGHKIDYNAVGLGEASGTYPAKIDLIAPSPSPRAQGTFLWHIWFSLPPSLPPFFFFFPWVTDTAVLLFLGQNYAEIIT